MSAHCKSLDVENQAHVSYTHQVNVHRRNAYGAEYLVHRARAEGTNARHRRCTRVRATLPKPSPLSIQVHRSVDGKLSSWNPCYLYTCPQFRLVRYSKHAACRVSCLEEIIVSVVSVRIGEVVRLATRKKSTASSQTLR